MRRISSLIILMLAIVGTASASELRDRLLTAKGIVSVDSIESGLFQERYVVMFTQPLDHKSPEKGTFTQRVIISHSGSENPTLMITEGYGAAYGLNPQYRGEISTRFNTNQVFVEHRFFGESTPDPRDWQYMTGENAAADLHAVYSVMKEIYPQKWVASGISKGGQNTMIYATFYPEDMDCYVPYVGPVCFGVEDGRHEPFLDRAGTGEDRQILRNFQIRLLEKREALLPLFQEFCNEKGYEFRLPIEQIYDYCVLEYPFTIWQWGIPRQVIPTADQPDEVALESLLLVVPPDYFAISDEPSFFVQAARELGYYGYDTKPFKGLLSFKSAKGYLHKIFLPEDAMNIKFTKKLANQIESFLRKNDPKMLFVYGEFDPWSAVMPSEKLFKGKENMKLYIEKNGSHRARIATLSPEDQTQVWNKLTEWLK